MKKISIFLNTLLAMLFAVACEKGVDDQMPIQFVPKGEITMDSSLENLQFSGNSETQTLTFHSNDEWKIISTREWITFSQNSGSAGDQSIELTVEKSYEDNIREAALTFVVEKLRKQIWLTQARGNVMQPEKSSYEYNTTDAVDDIEVNVHYNAAFSIKVEYDEYSEDWLTIDGVRFTADNTISIESPGEATIDKALLLSIDQNDESYNTRTAIVKLFNTELQTEEQFIVSQAGATPIYISDTQTESVGAINSTDSSLAYVDLYLEYDAKIGFSVTPKYSGEDAGWIDVYESDTKLDGDKFKIKLSVDKNSSKEATRTATLELRNDEHNVIRYITIVQDEYNDDIHIEITEQGSLATLITNAIAANTNLQGADYNRLYVTGDVALSSDDLKAIYTKLTKLKHIDISETKTTEIGTGVFTSKTALQTIKLPSTLEKIATTSFNASGLTKIEIPGSCKIIEFKAFGSCASLEEVIINDGAEEIGYQAFGACPALRSVSIPKSITTWSQDATFASKAFVNCTSLTDLKLEEGLTTIGTMAFLYCQSLEEVYIPGSVEWDIQSTTGFNKAFSDCASLRSVTIGDGMKSMSGSIFNMCKVLENLTLHATSVPLLDTLGSSCGLNSSLFIYVPNESYDLYLRSMWSTYSIKVIE